MEHNNTSKRDNIDIIRGALVNFIGILASSLNFIFYIILGRLYGSEITGLYLLSWASIDVASKLGILGLDRGILTIAARHHADDAEEDLYRAIAQALFIGLLATTVMIVFLQIVAIPIAEQFYQKPELVLPLRVMTWGMPFWTISAILLFTTRALRIMRYEVITKRVVEPLVMLLLAIPFHMLGMGILGLSIAFLLSVIIGALMSIWFFSRELSLLRVLKMLFDKKGRTEFFRFAAPIGIYDMLNLLLQRIDMFMVGRYVSTSMIGIYAIAEEVAFTVKKVRQSFDPIFIPVLASAHQSENISGMLSQYRNVTRWILILNTALFGMIVLAGESLIAVFGSEFIVGYTTLVLLTLSVIINGVLGVSELFILITKPIINLANAIGTIVINISLNLLLIPKYGMEGAALAIVISYSIMNTARLIEVAILFNLHPFTKFHAKALVSGIVSFLVVYGCLFVMGLSGVLVSIVAAVLYLIIYFPILYIIGMADEEKAVAKKVLNYIGIKKRKRKI